ncbi:hypothetical protein NWE55_08745 [Myroides albus]|uniref:Bacterial Ig-like domain-containing protein n=1 Tax=Myroides albus TaxID=2562892 RepID=A0A6I3LIS7_9FLAO|nr:immunoglobulin-like domain-containing protein [Myroides albus]MTG98478.1 hypothetical protein [Myroides albus]UVD78235.1 hypothetical protein NWE55_08745 [Myroides albus]
MKKLFVFPIVFLSCLFSMSCNQTHKNSASVITDTNSTSPVIIDNKHERQNALYDRVKVDLVEGRFTEAPSEIELSIWNQSQEVIKVKGDYRICILEGREWIPIDFEDLSIGGDSYVISKGVSVKVSVQIHPNLVEYKQGDYRVSVAIDSDVGEVEVDGYFSIVK